MFTCCPVKLKCLLNRVQKILIAKWFGQKLDGTRFQSFDRHGNVAMRRDKDDRDTHAQFCQLFLEIQPTHLRQSDIKNQATRVGGTWLFEKLLACCKRFGTKTN